MNPFTAALVIGALAAGAPAMPQEEHASPEGAGTRRQRDPKPPKNDGHIPAKTLRRRERLKARANK